MFLAAALFMRHLLYTPIPLLMVGTMEKWFSSNGHLATMLSTGWESLSSAGLVEILCALIIPLLAILISRTLSHWSAQQPSETLHQRVIKFLVALVGPLVALVLLTLAAIIVKSQTTDLFLLPFVFKLAAAWLAIRIVMLMSYGHSAGWVITLVIIPVTILHLLRLWEPLVDTLSEITFKIGKTTLTAYGVVSSAAAVIALFWLTGFMVNATGRWLQRSERLNISTRVLMMKFFQILLYFIVFMIGLQILGIDLTALSVLGGALGVGIGFGLQKIASNFISGIILLFERSVEVGDRIVLDDGTSGIVRQTAARYTLLELFDGRKMFIPNEEFITNRVISQTHGSLLTRMMVPVSVCYECDIELATKLLLQAVEECADCMKEPAPFAEMDRFADSGIIINLFFWLPDITKGVGGPKHQIMLNILRLFRENDISIPYPHQVAVNDPALVAQIEALKERLVATAQAELPAAASSEAKPRRAAKRGTTPS